MNIMIKGNIQPIKRRYIRVYGVSYVPEYRTNQTKTGVFITLFLAFIHCQIYFGYILLTSTYIHSHSLYLYTILIQSYELVGSCEKTTNKIKC